MTIISGVSLKIQPFDMYYVSPQLPIISKDTETYKIENSEDYMLNSNSKTNKLKYLQIM